MAYVNSGSVRLYVEEAGAGVPILFVHELASDLRQWERQVAWFAPRFRCVRYNARGYPPSDVPADDEAYVYGRFVDDIGAVLDGLGLERAYLVGWSMGAYASLLFGLRHPDRVKGIAAAGVGTGTPTRDLEQVRASMRALAEVYDRDGAEAGAAVIGEGANRQPLRNNHPEAYAAWMADLRRHSAAGMARTCRNYQGRRPSLRDFSAELAAMTLPVLLPVGQEDEPCLEATRWLAQTIPGSRLHEFPDVGHAPNLEDPEVFNRTLDAFLESVEQS